MNFAKISRPKHTEPERDLPLGFCHRLGYAAWREVFPRLPSEAALPSAKAARVIDAVLSYASWASFSAPGRSVSYSRSNDWWDEARQYAGTDFSCRTVKHAVETIIAHTNAFDAHWKAPSGPTSTGWQSTFTPSLELGRFASRTQVVQSARSLVVKSKKSGYVAPREVAKAERVEIQVDRLNALISKIKIGIDVPEGVTRDGDLLRFPSGQVVNLAATSMTRIFNDAAMEHGGRFYGPFWQSLPSAVRKTALTIDGCRTTEIDYSQIHPRMLYAISGERLDGDAYTVDGIIRDDAKIAWMIVINAGDLPGAVSALSYKLAEDRKVKRVKAHVVEARAMIDAIKAAHPKIERWFHSGIGIRLQKFDSDICATVLDTMASKGIACLPVHDSFIVKSEFAGILDEVMTAAYDRWVRDVASTFHGKGGTNIVPMIGRISLHTLPLTPLSPPLALPESSDSESYRFESVNAFARVGSIVDDLEDTFFPTISISEAGNRAIDGDSRNNGSEPKGEAKTPPRATETNPTVIQTPTRDDGNTRAGATNPKGPTVSKAKTLQEARGRTRTAETDNREPEPKDEANHPSTVTETNPQASPLIIVVPTGSRPPIVNRRNPNYVAPPRRPHPMVKVVRPEVVAKPRNPNAPPRPSFL